MITKQSLARSFFDLCKPNYNLNVKKKSTNTNILSFYHLIHLKGTLTLFFMF